MRRWSCRWRPTRWPRPRAASGAELASRRPPSSRPASRVRADDRLVELGLASSRDEAARLVLAGLVLDGTRRVEKAGEAVAADAPLTVRHRGRFVSRGGDKLEAALEHLRVDVRGAACLDAGCSTGGFTDCLLQRGASKVYAVDVGYGQFAWSLRTDPRVALMERTNVRAIDLASLDPRPTVVVADLSFVSLASILPSLVRVAAPAPARPLFVLLVKPQFEVAGRDTERGVVVSPEVREAALRRVEEAVARAGLLVTGRMESPVRGAEGNVEYLLAATVGEADGARAGAATEPASAAAAADALAEPAEASTESGDGD